MLYKKSELTTGLFFKIKSKTRGRLSDLSPALRRIWIEKYHPKYNITTEIKTTGDVCERGFIETYDFNAGFIPEFSEITEIAIGVIEQLVKNKPLAISIVPLSGKGEKALLAELATALDKMPGAVIGGYNIANYQIPFAVKKMIANKVPIPFLFNLRGKKPWDINMIDIMRDYQGNMFGDIDIELVANQFGVKYEDKEIGTAAGELRVALEIALAMSI